MMKTYYFHFYLVLLLSHSGSSKLIKIIGIFPELISYLEISIYFYFYFCIPKIQINIKLKKGRSDIKESFVLLHVDVDIVIISNGP